MKRKNLMMKKLSAVIISATMLFSGRALFRQLLQS